MLPGAYCLPHQAACRASLPIPSPAILRTLRTLRTHLLMAVKPPELGAGAARKMGSWLMRVRYTAVALSRSYTNSRPSLVMT